LRQWERAGTFSPIGWSADGRWIYAANGFGAQANAVIRIGFDVGVPEKVFDIPAAFRPLHDTPAMAPDRQSFILTKLASLSDVFLIERRRQEE
jgi:hypothetical protein